MISVDEAVARIVAKLDPLKKETVPISEAAGRTLAEDAVARLDQPPADVSSMDGYALRSGDIHSVPATLKIVGTAPAGHPFRGRIGAMEAVRIFTGGFVPDGADCIVIQEDTACEGDMVTIKAKPAQRQHVRVAGLDFRRNGILVTARNRLSARDLSLIAAGNVPAVDVSKRPRVALVATGDELSRAGQPLPPGGIVASSSYGLAALIEKWGGVADDLGILPDSIDAISSLPRLAAGCDLIVTIGGASVGDHDLVQRALAPEGFALDFWKVAMRPGKPLIFGTLGPTPLLGLPGNPVSSFVCAMLFLKPAIARLQGRNWQENYLSAKLARDLRGNGQRRDYVRAATFLRDGELWIDAFDVQDSSMLSVLARADALLVREIGAPPAKAGERVSFLSLD